MEQSTFTEPRTSAAPLVSTYGGSRFAEVWRAVSADPYDALPYRRLRASQALQMWRRGLYAAARRTLVSRADLLPEFDKLVHPLGICLRGHWRITESTPYTGLFAPAAEALVIARASDALGEYRPGKLRFLGLAGKLYPTSDPAHPTPLATANFVALENLGGARTKCFAAATLSTDLAVSTPRLGTALEAPLGAVAGLAFVLADRALSPLQPMIRQLYPLAEIGTAYPDRPVGPVVMRLVASPENRRVEAADLREELDMRHHPEGVRFEIHVSDHRSLLRPTGFRRIGELHFVESVASYSGDHRLHFGHAPYRRVPSRE